MECNLSGSKHASNDVSLVCIKTFIDARAGIIDFLSGIGNKIEKRGFISKQGQSNQLDLLRYSLGLG